MKIMRKYERLTKKKLLKEREICRLEQEALFSMAENGQTLYQIKLDIVLGTYQRFLQMLKEYSIVRRRKIRRESKNEMTGSEKNTPRKTVKRKKLSLNDDLAKKTGEELEVSHDFKPIDEKSASCLSGAVANFGSRCFRRIPR
jgi:hypothetical protein